MSGASGHRLAIKFSTSTPLHPFSYPPISTLTPSKSKPQLHQTPLQLQLQLRQRQCPLPARLTSSSRTNRYSLRSQREDVSIPDSSACRLSTLPDFQLHSAASAVNTTSQIGFHQICHHSAIPSDQVPGYPLSESEESSARSNLHRTLGSLHHTLRLPITRILPSHHSYHLGRVDTDSSNLRSVPKHSR
jgi:hypothetical protein